MEDDRLKDFIGWNKEDFDTEAVSNDLWSKIDANLGSEKNKSKGRFNLLAIAASVAVLLGIGLFMTNNSFTPDETAEVSTHQTDSPFETGLSEIDHHYAMVFAEKSAALDAYEVDPELKEVLDQLVDEFAELKKELEIGANPELVLEAMIDNYRLRISILEDLLQDLKNERKNPTSNEDEIV